MRRAAIPCGRLLRRFLRLKCAGIGAAFKALHQRDVHPASEICPPPGRGGGDRLTTLPSRPHATPFGQSNWPGVSVTRSCTVIASDRVTDEQAMRAMDHDFGHGTLTSSSLPRTVGRIPPRDPSGREITETAQRRIYFQHISEKHDPGIGVTVRNAIMPVELPSPIVFIVANVVNPISFVYNPAAGKNNDIRVVGERPVHSLFSRNCVGFFEVVFAETNFSVGEGVRTTF